MKCELENCVKCNDGVCPIYPEAGVKTFNRLGVCGFQQTITNKKGSKVNPLKASKRKGK